MEIGPESFPKLELKGGPEARKETGWRLPVTSHIGGARYCGPFAEFQGLEAAELSSHATPGALHPFLGSGAELLGRLRPEDHLNS